MCSQHVGGVKRGNVNVRGDDACTAVVDADVVAEEKCEMSVAEDVVGVIALASAFAVVYVAGVDVSVSAGGDVGVATAETAIRLTWGARP